MSLKPALLLTPLAALTLACVVTPRGRVEVVAPVPVVHTVYVEREPPPVRYERIPDPPSMEHHWVPGHWQWDGREYVWAPGHYQVRPRPEAVWMAGHWERHERGWFWIEGRWR